ncbi:hypothetical protein L2449_20215 [Mesorhizobium muleiense]|uniref:hypothetical protein n=1 Tax=Mesorhizobium muleiense TaxID=1004279 RepID=UPI001F270550|nr:hypothetical protein [Mesorhizobium muleiense]MCF6119179.1 hypothetical protein [Mesorhizobium muleiense]
MEGIHPNTGRDRKNRALQQIAIILARRASQNSESAEIRLLHHEIRDVSATITEDAGERDSLNSWIADGAFAKILSSEHDDFSWAAKRKSADASKRRGGAIKLRDLRH